MIEVKGVTRSFPVAGGDPFYALTDINAHIPAGKLTVLMGKSGSGKTTLTNILGALDQPTSGQVYLDGEDITRLSEGRRCRIRREKIGFVFQSVALIDVMSAKENVMFALRMNGKYRSAAARSARAEECLRMVGLGQRIAHMPTELSGGERQRVAIARAIAHAPKILFADEPTAQLDTNTGLQVAKIFRDLTEQEGVTVVFTTHDMGLTVIGDKVYELSDGRVVREETR